MRIVLLSLAALTGVALAATSVTAAPAADECLAKPKGVAPAGKHWYYSTDRKLQRKCWYLDDAGERTVAVAPRKPPAAARPVDTEREAAEPPQTADARAEFVEPSRSDQPAMSTPAPAPAMQPQSQTPAEAFEPAPAPKRDWSVASRWPEQSDAFASSPAPTTVASTAVARSEEPTPAAAPVSAPQWPTVVASGVDIDFGLIAGGLILLVVVGGTIMILGRRKSSDPERPLRHAMDRGDIARSYRTAQRPTFPTQTAERVSRSDVIDEVEQLLAARRQARESRAIS